ncbi:hypothetical protein B9T29_10260 [Acinetobacter sp. ANC 3903]|uniref:hypothetical protein n=1 Tax=Acinetobacter sp. ANC 3903 TaxID=1977883 RepID=UPI000A32E1CC|nr:hypothetical protein B9T29_10260 [Acinetobacter sp. ANC 3903]
MKIQQANKGWHNWSGSQQADPEIFQPRQLNELQQLVKSDAQIRAVGADIRLVLWLKRMRYC